MIGDEFLRHFRFCDEEDSGLSDEEQERKGPKKSPKAHTKNGYIKPRKTFWRNSKQLLILDEKEDGCADMLNKWKDLSSLQPRKKMLKHKFVFDFPPLCIPALVRTRHLLILLIYKTEMGYLFTSESVSEGHPDSIY